jgi:transposase-like protein
MEKQRRTYPEELKRNALELVRTSGKSAAAVARDLGIDPGLLNRWFMDAHRTRWSIGKMAKVLTVSVSGYYAWKGRKPSRRTLADATLVAEIRKIQKRHRRRYGSST